MKNLIPVLSAKQREEMMVYYNAYEKHAVEFSKIAMDDIKNHPIFGKLIIDTPKEVSEANEKLLHVLQKEAIVNGNWKSYIEHQIELGIIYAMKGLDFSSWCEVISHTRNHITPYLQKDCVNNIEFLTALNGMNSFIDIEMGIIGETYILKKREIIQKDQEEIKKLNEVLEQKVEELIITNKELAFQSNEREKHTALLLIVNRELAFQNDEREKNAAELIIANAELAFQSEEKGKRADELVIANKELVFQSEEKEKRAAELIIANAELAFQSEEKGKRADELVIANKELVFQSEEKGKRAAELIIANAELAFQSEEKGKRAAELIIANRKLAFENEEKVKRASELIMVNKELIFQNKEKEKRATELGVANKELVFQNDEKEKRAVELMITEGQLKQVNHELEAFSYSVAHDLRTPLRAINGYAEMLNEEYGSSLGDNGKRIIQTISYNARRMGMLVDDLLAFSRLGRKEISTHKVDMNELTNGVLVEVNKSISHNAKITICKLHSVKGDYTLLRQVMFNLISNAVKYSSKKENPVIDISSEENDGEIVFSIKDNGVGFDMLYVNKLFGVFQRLHSHEEFEGTGVGLAIVYRIITKHKGRVWAEGKLNEGAVFKFSLTP